MKTIDSKVKNPVCWHNGQLQYRSESVGKSYCLIEATTCSYYRQIKDTDHCTYKIQTKKKYRK